MARKLRVVGPRQLIHDFDSDPIGTLDADRKRQTHFDI